MAYNEGDGKFNVQELPGRAQLSCICSIETYDFNNDGIKDLILGGNNYNLKPQFSRQDASRGNILVSGDKKEYKNSEKSGFIVDGEVKGLGWVKNSSGKQFLITAINDEAPKVFKLN